MLFFFFFLSFVRKVSRSRTNDRPALPQGIGLERAIATHGGISDGADGDGGESEPDGHRAELQPDLGDAAGTFR